MKYFSLADRGKLAYELTVPSHEDGMTFVFINALTGHMSAWHNETITGQLQAAGHGTLCYNFRGQEFSSYSGPEDVTPQTITNDVIELLQGLQPPKPILVGLSIGGLFAAQAHLSGINCEALVFINTLRKPGVRLDWINKAMVAAATIGGSQLVMEMNLPHLVNPDFVEAAWPNAQFENYTPGNPEDGLYQLLAQSPQADWNVMYEDITAPVLSITGVHDHVFRREDDVAQLASRIANHKEIQMNNAGHLVPMERPEEFSSILLDYAQML